ncbi:MAG TPA: DeoR/GlpR family DNA-binding transcription regulator [Devosiaceae bacterium]|jgi:DeoR family glycerol-3-phosphate regulon repressor
MHTDTLSSRQLAIADLLNEKRYLQIDELARSFMVTTQTIRRDVAVLCESGMARRLHKGIKAIDFPGNPNLDYSKRAIMNVLAKREIAALAAELVPEDASVSLGIGTTPEQVAMVLSRRHSLLAVTNNLNVANVLSGHDGIKVHMCGGQMRPHDRDFVGHEAVALFGRYRVDFGITGVGGIDEDGNFLDFSAEEVAVRQSILENSRKRIIVADLSKFGRAAPVRGGSLNAVDILITELPPPPAVQEAARAAGVTMIHREPRPSHPLAPSQETQP